MCKILLDIVSKSETMLKWIIVLLDLYFIKHLMAKYEGLTIAKHTKMVITLMFLHLKPMSHCKIDISCEPMS